MSNATNSTLPPEVAAFVSNTRALIVGGAVAGGVVVGLIVFIIICCRRIRKATSDEVKDKRMKRRKIAYDIRRKGEEEERERLEAKRLRNGGRTKRGRVAAYDAGLEKSFAEVIGGALGSIRGSGDDNNNNIDDNDSGDDDWSPTVSPSLHSASGETMSHGARRNRSPSSVALGEEMSPTTPSKYTLPAAIAMDGSGTESVAFPPALLSTDATSEMGVLALEALNRSYSPHRRGELVPVLGSMRRIPVPRSAEEEAVVGRRHGLFAASVQASLAEEEAKMAKRHLASEEAQTKTRLEAEQRLLDGRQLVTGLSSSLSAATMGLQRGRSNSFVHSFSPTTEAATTGHSHRLRVVSTQDYYANTLL